ncbi:hypothetical protein ACTXT7_002938 [Hymenolepis weldensis]
MERSICCHIYLGVIDTIQNYVNSTARVLTESPGVLYVVPNPLKCSFRSETAVSSSIKRAETRPPSITTV